MSLTECLPTTSDRLHCRRARPPNRRAGCAQLGWGSPDAHSRERRGLRWIKGLGQCEAVTYHPGAWVHKRATLACPSGGLEFSAER